MITSGDFDDEFCWGVSSSAYQSEGAYSSDGKGLSIWDVFTHNRSPAGATGDVACDFYNRYMQDIMLMQYMNIGHFRFSLSWSRMMPEGAGRVNEEGIHFYNRLIDFCLEVGIEPWITVYHWDLPHALDLHGGWTSRSIVHWFSEFVSLCVARFGDRVKRWMIMSEPLVFTGGGYLLGLHAPGRKGLRNFLPAVHHAALCQAAGIRIIQNRTGLLAGTTATFCPIKPASPDERDQDTATTIDVLVNRLFLDPLMGNGYPVKDLKLLAELEQYMCAGDEHQLSADVDFIAVQAYSREFVRFSRSAPYLNARFIRGAYKTGLETAWEQSLSSLEEMIAAYRLHAPIRKIFVTVNGAACGEEQTDGKVHDPLRIATLQAQVATMLKAKSEGAPIAGYFAPNFTDSFEWSEGFTKRLGLVHLDYATQRRVIKASGHWYRSFLLPHHVKTFRDKLAV